MSSPRYICAGCGTCEHLYAVAGSNVSGRLLADGSVEESHSEQWGTHEDSIECQVHLSGFPILELIDGVYYRFEGCTATDCVNGCRMSRDGSWVLGKCETCDGVGDRDIPVTDTELAAWREKATREVVA